MVMVMVSPSPAGARSGRHRSGVGVVGAAEVVLLPRGRRRGRCGRGAEGHWARGVLWEEMAVGGGGRVVVGAVAVGAVRLLREEAIAAPTDEGIEPRAGAAERSRQNRVIRQRSAAAGAVSVRRLRLGG